VAHWLSSDADKVAHGLLLTRCDSLYLSHRSGVAPRKSVANDCENMTHISRGQLCFGVAHSVRGVDYENQMSVAQRWDSEG
jgi:hypothetical protein